MMNFCCRMMVFAGLACLLAVLTGCATTYVPATQTHNELVGAWRWVKSVGGFAFETRTPETEGYHQTVQFDGDGTYRLYRDGQLQVTFDYVLKNEYHRWLRRIADIVYYYHEGNPQIEQSYHLRGDTLTLSDLNVDGFAGVYVRVGD
jgi:hypothetical protein